MVMVAMTIQKGSVMNCFSLATVQAAAQVVVDRMTPECMSLASFDDPETWNRDMYSLGIEDLRDLESYFIWSERLFDYKEFVQYLITSQGYSQSRCERVRHELIRHRRYVNERMSFLMRCVDEEIW